ncbi:hypothetical protein FOZ60_008126 [Perkinsus olseni]|uniref:Uncharacterized protein n=1 Tax=Perkinsus olseni TaxID=32597 RepID=A0A7J6NL39_PEROL|nr:hypothetical protein FOZ60_008126 [Perkinsus olseni]
MLHLVALSAAALVIASVAQDEHAWLVAESGAAFDDSFEDMDEGAISGVANKTGLPGFYERPTGKCTLSVFYEVIGCHCGEDEIPRGIENSKGLLAVACAPPCDYRRVLGQAGGFRALNGRPLLSCATPQSYGTVCWDGSCFTTPKVIRGDALNGNVSWGMLGGPKWGLLE